MTTPVSVTELFRNIKETSVRLFYLLICLDVFDNADGTTSNF